MVKITILILILSGFLSCGSIRAKADTFDSKLSVILKQVNTKYSTDNRQKIINWINFEAKRNKIDPYLIATTAYVESEFSQNSQPCIGVMQVYLPTYRELCKKNSYLKNYNPYNIHGNLVIGAKELALDYCHKNNKYSESNRLKYMWGRYNGCGISGDYTRKSLCVYLKLKNLSAEQLSSHLKKKELWR